MRLVTRKIKKGLYGFTMPSFNNVGNAFSNAVQPNLNFLSQMGDMTALSLVTNQNLGQRTKSLESTEPSYIDLVNGNTNNTNMSPTLGITGLFLGSMYDNIPTLDKVYNSNDLLSSDIRGGTSKALLSGAAGPWGVFAGGLLMGFDKTGGFTDASKGLGNTNDALNMIASLALPGAGWFTKRTMDYEVSDDLLQNGASYAGTLSKANTAALNAGAKILFGRSKANKLIGNAILSDNKVLNIMAENEIALAGANNPFINLKNQFNLSGGWQLGTITFGRLGLKLSPNESSTIIHKIKPTEILLVDYQQIEEYKNGGSIVEHTPTEILLINPNDIQEFLKGGQINKKSRTLEELILYAKEVNPRFILRMSEPLKYVEWDDNEGHHFGTHELGYTEMDGKYFVYPSILEGNDGNLIRYTPEDWKQAVDNAYKNKNGLFFNTKEEAKIFTESLENPDGTFSGYKSGWSEFFKLKPTKYLNGGTVNVIPDGALHARKHNMDIEGITKKGIPVISNNGELLAEIELNEIIFRLEVTKKLEELLKIFYNEESSNKEKEDAALEAGKLLTQEILYNTLDNTGLLEQIN